MTVIAVVAAGNMRRILACSSDTIMTRAATSEYLRVINGHDGHKSNRRVAVFTDICRSDVSWTLAGCVRAIVTGTATPDHLCVIDGRHWCEHSSTVAVFADIGRLNVRGIFTGCLRAVVTTDTITGDIHVVEKHG